MEVQPPTEPEAVDHVDNENEAGWPLSYRLMQQHEDGTSTDCWWSHELYRGPSGQRVEILYSKTRDESETIAQKFLSEPIVGFDMEWAWDCWKEHKKKKLQEQVGLIQVACEDKIALFHIGLHVGKTTEEVIAPSLQKLIESPDIAKAGVAVLSADFRRLVKELGLQPQAAFELSHLDRLVRFGGCRPEEVNTKLVALADQVENHLGFPLHKGSVRKSNWTKDLSLQQIDYAAADAYAGFMLFHCLNSKRVAMEPVPPLPMFADKYLPYTWPPVRTLQLNPLEGEAEMITAAEFFGQKAVEAEDEDGNKVEDESKMEVEHKVEDAPEDSKEGAKPAKRRSEKPTKVAKIKAEAEPLDPVSLAIYDELVRRRKALAKSENVAAYVIAHNSMLEGIARLRPADVEGLLQVKGCGKGKVAKYGAEWLEVIRSVEGACNEQHPPQTAEERSPTSIMAQTTGPDSEQPMSSSRRGKGKSVAVERGGFSSSPGFETPPPPQLHTGLSFSLEQTDLASEEVTLTDDEAPTDEDDTSKVPSGEAVGEVDAAGHDASVPAAAHSRPESQLKRKRVADAPSDEICTAPTARAEPLSPRSRIFRSKLGAFSRLVASMLTKLGLPPESPIVSEEALDQIVSVSPQTAEELQGIPGLEYLATACVLVEKDLLQNIIKFAQAPR